MNLSKDKYRPTKNPDEFDIIVVPYITVPTHFLNKKKTALNRADTLAIMIHPLTVFFPQLPANPAGMEVLTAREV